MALLRWSVFECHRRHLDTDLTNQRLVLDDLIWQVKPFTIQFFFPSMNLSLLNSESIKLIRII